MGRAMRGRTLRLPLLTWHSETKSSTARLRGMMINPQVGRLVDS